jgi:PPP family 3-phenylpropionic acid transporter
VVALRLVVLALGAALGVFFPFVAVILQGFGFDAAQIGLTTAVAALGFTLALPFWGHLADARLGRVRALQICAVGGALAIGLLLGSWPPIVVALLLTVYSVFQSSWQSLADALTVNIVPSREYGRVRVLTSLSFGVSTIAAGFLYDVTGYSAAFVLLAVFALVMGASSAGVPDVERIDLASAANAARASSSRRCLGSAVVAVRVAPRLVAVLFAVMLLHITIIGGFTFLPLRLAELGGAPSDVALSGGVSALSEIPAMIAAAFVARRIGLRGMFVVSALMYAIATASWIVLETPLPIIATRVLTGTAFALVIVAVVLTIARLLPPELQATGQSLYQAVAFGAAAIVANVVGGFLYQAIGYTAVFGLGASLAVLAAILGAIVFPRDAQPAIAGGPGRRLAEPDRVVGRQDRRVGERLAGEQDRPPGWQLDRLGAEVHDRLEAARAVESKHRVG